MSEDTPKYVVKNGKGSGKRPMAIRPEEFDRLWEQIKWERKREENAER